MQKFNEDDFRREVERVGNAEQKGLAFDKPKIKLPEDEQGRLDWLNIQIQIYIDKYGFFKLPTVEDSEKITEEGKSYCKEEINKLINGISEETGVDVYDLKKYVDENKIDLKKIALRLLRKKREKEEILQHSFSVDMREEPDYAKSGSIKTLKQNMPNNKSKLDPSVYDGQKAAAGEKEDDY